MRISLNWLHELVDFELSPSEIAEALTMVGFEVEEIEDRRTWAEGVVIGSIVSAEPHPRADRLQVCQVEVGQPDPLTIVCGAANARAGITVPVALVGTFLPAINLKIEQADKRGVPSSGMICSLAELGLAKSSEGIHEFSPELNLKLGSDVRPWLGLDDVVLDLTSTANRADALSMVGIAREVAAITRSRIRLPAIPPLSAPAIPTLRLEIADPKACPVYSGSWIRGVKIGASPLWLQQRLEAAGTRSINNVVDITNLVLLEWGQPLHAFDWQQLQARMGANESIGVWERERRKVVGVRLARADETLITLDGQQRILQPDNLLITAADQPVALAGVMGGGDSEITEASQEIFLEAALFDPVFTRRSARAQTLRTEASARYERGVNGFALDQARDRAIQLILELAGGELVGQTVVDARPSSDRQLSLRLSRLIDIMGDDIKPTDVEEILSALGFELSPCQNEPDPSMPASETATTARCVWQVTVPSYRLRDIEREIDLIEEFARLYGYDHFSETLPPETQVGSLSLREQTLRRIREAFRGVGLTELFHISLCATDPQTEVVIANPLSPEFAALRSTVLPGLLQAFQYNWDQGNGSLSGFEIGRVFARQGEGYRETDQLGGILGGQRVQQDWQHQSQPLDWYAAKGVLMTALGRLGLHPQFQPDPAPVNLHPGRTASLQLGDKPLGIFGQLHPQVTQSRDLPAQVYVFELDIEVLVEALGSVGIPIYQPFSSYPPADRDIAFFAPLTVSVAEISQRIRVAAGELLESVQLFDEYRGEGVPEGSRSLAFRLFYRAGDRTLTDPEVEAAQQQVRTQLQSAFRVVLRS